jgi:hypothetical protein
MNTSGARIPESVITGCAVENGSKNEEGKESAPIGRGF